MTFYVPQVNNVLNIILLFINAMQKVKIRLKFVPAETPDRNIPAYEYGIPLPTTDESISS
jgi:hypothetical protein